MSRILPLGFIFSLLWSAYWGARAMANRSEEGRSNPLRSWFLGVSAGRRHFTDRGWRYRQLSVWAGMGIWVIVVVIDLLLK